MHMHSPNYVMLQKHIEKRDKESDNIRVLAQVQVVAASAASSSEAPQQAGAVRCA